MSVALYVLQKYEDGNKLNQRNINIMMIMIPWYLSLEVMVAVVASPQCGFTTRIITDALPDTSDDTQIGPIPSFNEVVYR